MPLALLLPIARGYIHGGLADLEKVGADPLFDRNVIRVVTQFAVGFSFFLELSFLSKFHHCFQQELSPCFIGNWGLKSNVFGGVAVLAQSQDQNLAQSQDRGLAQSQDQNLAQLQDRCLARPQDRGHPRTDLVFVTDAESNQIQSFRCDGTAVKQWGCEGSADGQFRYPSDVAVLSRSKDRGDCILFVTDYDNHRIQVFGIDGSFIRKWGSQGRADGQFNHPSAVAIHPIQDLVYVTEWDNDRVQVFDLDGTFIRKWGIRGSEDGQFECPSGVTIHPTRDLIFVAEGRGDRIQAFRSDGTFMFKWGSKGSTNGQFISPAHIVLYSARNLLLVSDRGNHRVQVFDLEGTFLQIWGYTGKADGAFTGPWGISVHPTKDVVYVGDRYCIQAFSLFPNVRKCKILTNLAERKRKLDG